MDLSKILGHLENAPELIKQIEAEVGREFVPRADFNSKNNEYKNLEKQVGDLQNSLDALNKEKSTYEQTLADRDGKLKTYELSSLKAQIAHEKGIPYELAGRLTGDDEKTLREDAETLAKLVNTKQAPPPLKNTEPTVDGKDAAYKSLLNGLKGE